MVVYTGAVPDAFKATREVVMTGTRQGDVFVAQREFDDHQVPVEVRQPTGPARAR